MWSSRFSSSVPPSLGSWSATFTTNNVFSASAPPAAVAPTNRHHHFNDDDDEEEEEEEEDDDDDNLPDAPPLFSFASFGPSVPFISGGGSVSSSTTTTVASTLGKRKRGPIPRPVLTARLRVPTWTPSSAVWTVGGGSRLGAYWQGGRDGEYERRTKRRRVVEPFLTEKLEGLWEGLYGRGVWVEVDEEEGEERGKGGESMGALGQWARARKVVKMVVGTTSEDLEMSLLNSQVLQAVLREVLRVFGDL
ncbi:hypothetical protein GTA08_BOTSDO08065 [Botryosphaeria dothidea]|uniref:Uncharacterized protein n=1 Tax=Botryosphaeria dothidea TaxID=55169 RepID=A0A8H4IME2_9PEZI|nr:hypothetical protein GTA08_BOTSDO08065 [Botryosphaeria dothidea]